MAIYNLNYTDLTDIYVNVSGVGKLTFNSVTGEFKLIGLDGTTIVQQGVTTSSSMPNYNFYFPTGYNGIFRNTIDSMAQTGQSGTSKWQYEGDVPLVASTPEPTPQPSTDIDLNSGFGEKDLTTNIITYFAKQFKLKASDFVMNSDGIVEINPEKLASITVDLTNIVNTSITTQNLTATTSNIGTATAETLTTDGLTATTSSLGQSSASKMEVGTGGLIWTDAQGHKHQFVSE